MGADCDYDHYLLVAKMKIRVAEMYAVEVKNCSNALDEEERTLDELWPEIRIIFLDVTKTTLG